MSNSESINLQKRWVQKVNIFYSFSWSWFVGVYEVSWSYHSHCYITDPGLLLLLFWYPDYIMTDSNFSPIYYISCNSFNQSMPYAYGAYYSWNKNKRAKAHMYLHSMRIQLIINAISQIFSKETETLLCFLRA